MPVKQYFQLIGERRVLAMQRGKPAHALIVGHFQSLDEMRAKSLPLIGAELGHQVP
jgi:hypothetical protein